MADAIPASPEDSRDRVTEANRRAWDEAAGHHRAHEQYRRHLAGFRAGAYSCLDGILTARLRALGLEGRSVVQICCNNGREILSVKNLGAGRCLGIDQSAAFLAQAEELAAAGGGIDCAFHCGNVYELPAAFDRSFDIALVTIGVFGWMPDLYRFFAMAARLRCPGGRLVAYEDHPILNMFPEAGPGPAESSYFDRGPWVSNDGLDYYGHAAYRASPCYWTAHKLSDVLTAAIRNGLAIEEIEELSHNVGCWEAYENQPAQLPLSYLLVARKQETGGLA